MPEPVLGEDGHYLHFNDVYGTQEALEIAVTQETTSKKRKTALPFNVTQQHVKNVNLVIQCEECQLWRLLFSKKKLNSQNIAELEKVIEDISYTCGASFEDIQLPDDIEVFVKIHSCNDPIEKLYYSCGFQAICVYCGSTLQLIHSDEYYPQCVLCTDKSPIKRTTRRRIEH